jgi:hypothetical protein
LVLSSSWRSALSVTVFMEGFWLFLVTITYAWHGLPCAPDSITLPFLEWALMALRLAPIQILRLFYPT